MKYYLKTTAKGLVVKLINEFVQNAESEGELQKTTENTLIYILRILVQLGKLPKTFQIYRETLHKHIKSMVEKVSML